jgi:putative oxidoreductase
MTAIRTFEPYTRSILRVVAGFTFSLHGLQKLLGLFGGMGGSGARAHFFSLLWAAGFLEMVGGGLIILGLFTTPAAFIISGEMAVAYFMVHFSQSFFPILNRGESATLYCFIFLYFFAAGPGPWSVDEFFLKKSGQSG